MLDYEPTWTEWFYVFAPFQIYLIITAILVCYGDHGDERNWVKQFFKRISNALERWTGYPGWAMAGALTGLLMLGTAAIGLYWDVGFHVDFGRDEQLFTPSHTMIVAGLVGLGFAALIATVFASIDKADVDLQFGPVRVPWTAVTLAFFGLAGGAAFPFDAMWHDAYGVDVTLWSPSHLQLLTGGGIATIAVWLMLREGLRHAPNATPTMLGRGIEVTILGAVLTGLSIYQGEFDFGLPQFQVLYLPLLIAAVAGVALVLARLALGPWGAVKTAFAFIIIRLVIGLLVVGPFNETFPWFPLYLVSALAVEGVAYVLGTENRLTFAVAAGALVGTVGVAADVLWFGAMPSVLATPASLLKTVVLSPLAAIAGAVLGAALARPVPHARVQVPAAAALAGGLALLAIMAYPLPRNVGHVEADIRLRPASDGRAVVEVDLHPADAAESATSFGVVSWQGGGRITAALDKVGEGKYVASKPLPITGRWKTTVGLQRGSEVMAAPVYLPPDPKIGDGGVAAVPERHEVFARNTTWLLREQKPGGALAANAAYTGMSVVVIALVALYTLCAIKVAQDQTTAPAFTPRPPPMPGPPPGSNGRSAEPTPVTPAGASWGWPARPDSG